MLSYQLKTRKCHDNYFPVVCQSDIKLNDADLDPTVTHVNSYYKFDTGIGVKIFKIYLLIARQKSFNFQTNIIKYIFHKY